MKDWLEQWGPCVSGIIVLSIYMIFFQQYQLPGTFNNLLSSVVSICAVSIGFLMTTKSILFTIRDSEIINWIKKAGLFGKLIDYIMTAIHLCFILAIYSALCLLMNASSLICAYSWVFGFWLLLSTITISSCYRVIFLLSKILRKQQ